MTVGTAFMLVGTTSANSGGGGYPLGLGIWLANDCLGSSQQLGTPQGSVPV